MALSWKELSKLITKMKAKDKDKPAVYQDGNTGEYVGFTEIVTGEEDGVIHLFQDNCEPFPQTREEEGEDPDPVLPKVEPEFDFLVENEVGSPAKFYPQSDRARRFMEESRSAVKSGDHYAVKDLQFNTYICDLTDEGMTWRKK